MPALAGIMLLKHSYSVVTKDTSASDIDSDIQV